MIFISLEFPVSQIKNQYDFLCVATCRYDYSGYGQSSGKVHSLYFYL